MIEKQDQYLKLAVIEQKSYDEITKILEIDRTLVSQWWDELKVQREYLSKLRKIWKAKFENTETTDSFWEFKNWYEKTGKKCFYCGITQEQLNELHKRKKVYTKRNRGRILEIERLKSDEPYSNLENCVFSCYWCNNAKTDTFTSEEFKIIGEKIGEIWKNRLKK